MTVTMDEHDLRSFAAAVVLAQREFAAELQASDKENSYREFEAAPWDWKWGFVVNRALMKMPL